MINNDDKSDFLKIGNNKNIHTLSVYVNNSPGVLARIAQVFARRSYNIDSLVVSHSRDKRFSRMTIVVSGKAEMLNQIISQVNKLVDVIRCHENNIKNTVIQELGLIKFKVDEEKRIEALQIVSHFNAKTSDLQDSSIIATIHGDSEKINALIRAISKFEILEVVRTGQIAMSRGIGLT